MLFRFLSFSVIALALAMPHPTQAKPVGGNCVTKKFDGISVNWCHERDAGSSKVAVYYFHGIGGSEKSWNNSALGNWLQSEAGRLRKGRPHVFSVSFGPAWFLTDVKKEAVSSRLEIFVTKVLPAMDAQMKSKPQRRILIGESMGGFNALRAAMSEPAKFDKVIALCPALLPIGPYATEAEENAFAERNPHMDAQMMRDLKPFMQGEFPSPVDWAKNNPVDRMMADAQEELPSTFLSSNEEDQYGFQEATSLFAEKVGKKFSRGIHRPLGGSHCAHTPELLKEAAAFALIP